jgi:hypothetical protein
LKVNNMLFIFGTDYKSAMGGQNVANIPFQGFASDW